MFVFDTYSTNESMQPLSPSISSTPPSSVDKNLLNEILGEIRGILTLDNTVHHNHQHIHANIHL